MTTAIGNCIRAQPGGGGGSRQNPAKNVKEYNEYVYSHYILDFGAPSHHNLTKLVTIFLYI